MKKINRADRQRRHEELIAQLRSDFDFWSRGVWLRHPNDKAQAEAWEALVTVFQDPQEKTLFDSHHKLWCDSLGWRKEHGRHAPTLADFIRQGGYRGAPARRRAA